MERIKKELIAPCGMNCGVCQHYLRKENKCPGCFTGRKMNNRLIKCGRRLCSKRKGEYCFECDEFPCKSIQALDKRYREKYGMSVIKNLNQIKDEGIKNFIICERQKWQSEKGILCVHDKNYY